MRLYRVATRVVAEACIVAAVMAAPALARTTTNVTLNAVGAKKHPASLVTFRGRAGTRAGMSVVVERRAGRKWRTLASGRTGRRGMFALTWITPSHRGRFVVRARLGRTTSRTRRFRVLAPRSGAHLVIVSSKAQVISASAVHSVPRPGKTGSITYAGGNNAKVGQILIVGQGEGTPNGFIGRVTNVKTSNGNTVATTVPATLLQAVPQGSLNLVAKSVTASPSALHRAKETVSCTGSAGFSITHSVTFSTNLDLKADWTLVGGLQSASLTASAGLNASVQAAVSAAGQCSLGQRTLISIKGPSIDTFVGPIPVVMTSNLYVYLNASASAQAQISTSASAGFSASAGVGWTSGDGFYGIHSFSPHFSFQPPSVSATADAEVTLTPTVDVLLYGLVGPEVALKTGIEFSADTTQNPWWTLSVPVDVTASVSIPPLDLESPELDIYDHSYAIADAGGPFGSTGNLPPVHNVATPATSLAAGYDQSCALRSPGAVACWGGNPNGELGRGAAGGSSTPVAVSGITDAAAVVAGNNHTCALQVAGGVMCWGEDTDGELGDGGSNPVNLSPVAVSGLTNAVAIAAGAKHTCAVLQTGHVDCWGADDQNQLGDGGGNPSSFPVDVGITGAASIAAGSFHTCVVTRNHTVVCWGNNVDGSLGNGTTNPESAPVTVTGINTAVGVAAGDDHSCAVLTDGTVWCWGYDNYGQLGNGTTETVSDTPVQVSGITNATQVSAGEAHACARLSTGSVECWGYNNYGQLGNGANAQYSDTPVTVTGITNATAVTNGFQHTCALKSTGGLSCWGYGVDGELGNGLSSTSSTPVTVSDFP
jgi:alpha-tubulin suppressor-like RCC1 family protein